MTPPESADPIASTDPTGADPSGTDPTGAEPSRPASTSPRRRPGGRTARTRRLVLDAVLAELGEHGYDGLTVEAVAARAGVHRTTVHRRWRDVGGLLTDVYDAADGDDWQPPDTGSLEGDLVALNQEVHDALTAQPSVVGALIAASFRSERAAEAQRRLWEGRYGRSGTVVERAVERGELAGAVDARSLLLTATAPLYHQLVLLGGSGDPGLPARAARTAVLAAAAGAFDTPPGDGSAGDAARVAQADV